MELYLIRHTTPDINAGICYGRSDIDVAATFEAEVEAVLYKLAEAQPTAIYTSPSQRCRRLAQLLAQTHQCSFVEDERLMELHFGEWEMRGWQEISLEDLERWGSSYIQQGPPGGEAYQALHQRARLFGRSVHFRCRVSRSSYARRRDSCTAGGGGEQVARRYLRLSAGIRRCNAYPVH